MAKGYTYTEEKGQMVKEDVATSYSSNSIADAIWTLIVNQTVEVQTVIAERLYNLRNKVERKTYAIEDVNSCVNEVSQKMRRDEILSEDVRTHMQTKQSRMDAFAKFVLDERPSELDDSVVLAECKAARQELYNQLR